MTIRFRLYDSSEIKSLILAIALIFGTTNRASAQGTAALQLAPNSSLVTPTQVGYTPAAEQRFQSAWNGVLQSLVDVLNIPEENRTLDNTVFALHRIHTNLGTLSDTADIILHGERLYPQDDIGLAARHKSSVLALQDAVFPEDVYAEIRHLSQKPTLSPEDRQLLDRYFEGLKERLNTLPHLIIPKDFLSKFSVTSEETFDSKPERSSDPNVAAQAAVPVKTPQPPFSRLQLLRPKPTTPGQEIPEGQLIALAQSGDRDSMDFLIEKYSGRIYLVILRMVGNPEDAKNTAQETLLKAFKNIKTFRSDSAFSTWLTRIAINEALMWRRRQKPTVSLDAPPGSEDADGGGPGDRIEDSHYENQEITVERRETRETIAEGIDRLRPMLRTAFVLRDIHDYSTDEAARILGITENTLKARLWRARYQMRGFLMRKGIGPRANGKSAPMNPPETPKQKRTSLRKLRLMRKIARRSLPLIDKSVNAPEEELAQAIAGAHLSNSIAVKEILEAIMKLSSIEREALILHDIKGLSHLDIARIGSIFVKTSQTRLTQARQHMYRLLDPLMIRYGIASIQLPHWTLSLPPR